MKPTRSALGILSVALLLALAVGIFGRGNWTPDEPREADIAWRMSWQRDKAVPLLAGDAFCEKPPLTYWIAGAAIGAWGKAPWIARLPNLLYALITALAVGSLGRRSGGAIAGWAAGAAICTLLLSYQVAIWLATDAPLLATVAVALLGLHVGFYARGSGERLRGYTCMHAALALGFLCKSAAGWMVPVLTLGTLVIWEKRYRELLKWELYLGLGLQAALILVWVGFVYQGPEGPAHLKVFLWNNLVGRFARIDAPQELQYAAAHRNSPGKYLLELPVYLWPWTLLVLAAARRAIRRHRDPRVDWRPVRFAIATFVPTLAVLSMAATARNIYLAPAFPGVALLLGWWIKSLRTDHDAWDRRALQATALLLTLAGLVLAFLVVVLGRDSWATVASRPVYVGVSAIGVAAGAVLAGTAWRRSRQGRMLPAVYALLLAYCALLVGPASQIYGRVDTWQDLASIGRAIARDADGRPLVLFAADETTRAVIDMYATPTASFIAGPVDTASTARLRARLAQSPRSLVVSQLSSAPDSRTLRELAAALGLASRLPAATDEDGDAPPWMTEFPLHIEHTYSLPNGRRYALLATDAERASGDTPGSHSLRNDWRVISQSGTEGP